MTAYLIALNLYIFQDWNMVDSSLTKYYSFNL